MTVLSCSLGNIFVVSLSGKPLDVRHGNPLCASLRRSRLVGRLLQRFGIVREIVIVPLGSPNVAGL
jgi:hypothetical protein